MHVPFSLTWIMNSGLLLGLVLSVCTCWFYNVVTTSFLLILVRACTSGNCLILLLFPCICSSVAEHTHTVLCASM
jgi:hypothetical protein